MCIIAIKPQGKPMFSDTRIRTMFANNPDGAGLMYCRQGKVVIEKGYLDVDSLLRRLHRVDFTDRTVVIHFRIGTSGYNDKMNCHPFPVFQKNELSCECNLAMAHNGILYDYTPPKKSAINDTQVFIQDVLNNLSKNFYKNKDVLMLIEELIGSNKFAFLDKDERLTLIGNFIEDDGYIYSNTSYKALKLAKKPVKKQTAEHKPFLSNVDMALWNDDDYDLWDEMEYERSRGWL